MKRVIIHVFVVVLSIAILAQELKHDVTVTLKMIQVFVMDKAGNPITDLNLDDFIVYDNKKLQKLTEFEKHILFPSEDINEPQPIIERTTLSSSENDVMNRKFFIFFDFANNNPLGFRKAQRAALHFINNELHPSDEVGVLSFSVLKGLVLHEYLTKDHMAVQEVVKHIGSEGRVGRADNFEAMIWRELSGQSGLDASHESKPILDGLTEKGEIKEPGDDVISNLRFERENNKSHIRHQIEKIIDLSKALRYLAGQKYFLFFSSGIPNSLLHGIEYKGVIRYKEFNYVDVVLRDKYQDMLKELSAANITIFSINTEPLIADINVPSQAKGEATLRHMSQYTGGKFLGNVQNFTEILDPIQDFTGSYYVLGYYVSESWDGRYHSINVNVNRPNTKIFAQRGYFNPKNFLKYSKLEKEIHLIDLALTEKPLFQNPVHLPMIAVPCPTEEDPAILMMTQIDGAEIKRSIGTNTEVFFLVFDQRDNIIELKRKALDQSGFKEKGAYVYSILPLSPGQYKYRFVIRDMKTGKGAVGQYSDKLSQSPDQGLSLFPPFLLSKGKSGLFVRGYVPKTKDNKSLLLNYYPFDPAEYAPLLTRIPAGTKSIFSIINCIVRDLSNPKVQFTAELINQKTMTSTPLELSILSGKKEGNIGTVFAELKLPELDEGEYILLMTAEDTVSKSRSQTSLVVTVQRDSDR